MGDPPHDRYAPEKDIYRYPTDDGQSHSGHQEPQQNQWTQYRSDHDDGYTSAAESEEVYKKPSRKVKTPTKPYREPHRRQVDVEEPNFQSQYPPNHNQPHTNEVNHEHPNVDPHARPPPNFDTNYNSPGMSKDPKITDWMPYSSKNYHELPGKKRSKTKYRTLPTSMRDYTPDPEHEKYPKITYDSISKRTLPVSAAPIASSPPRSKSARNAPPIPKSAPTIPTTSPPRRRPPLPRRKSPLELKTEKEFNSMLRSHTKLATIG
jgi:hypothetical protein